MSLIIFFIPLGLLSGLLAGLLGIGGGFLVVPGLYLLLKWKGLFPHYPMHIAIVTSLAVTFFTTVISTIGHHRKKFIEYSYIYWAAPGLIIGSILGSILAAMLSTAVLKTIFGILAAMIGGYFCIPAISVPKLFSKKTPLLSAFGFVIGSASSFLGIGGGVLSVPLLYCYGLPTPSSVATSSAITMLSSFIGSLAYWTIAEIGGHPETMYWNALIAISLSAMAASPLGVYLSYFFPAKIVRILFGCALAATGVTMLVL